MNYRKCLALWLLPILLFALPRVEAGGQDAASSRLDPLIRFLLENDDDQTQIDVIKGISDALKGVPSQPMPGSWPQLEERLNNSNQRELRTLVRNLAVKFGSVKAQEATRQIARNPAETIAERKSAIATLVATSDEALLDILLALVDEVPLRSTAIRGLARFSDSRIPTALIAVYPRLSLEEKRDVLSTLTSRSAFALPLLEAVSEAHIPRSDLNATLIRQLRNLADERVTARIASVWGMFREPSKDKLEEMARYRGIYRAGGSTPGDATRGRAVFVRTCQQCHRLFGIGGQVGPDITGSDRGNLNYLLENIIDPNGVIPNDYRTTIVETSDDRILTGIVTQQNAAAMTLLTANESLTIPTQDIIETQTSALSMMPEGLLTTLEDQAVRDLLYYLRQPAQAPLVAEEENLGLFFNTTDLTGWDGDLSLWKVENGTLIGHTEKGLAHNEFLKSEMIFSDFRLTVDVKLSPDSENSGIQFRSQALPNGEVKGYQADIGQGWWGKLYEELGRGLLWDKPANSYVNPGDWNRYEILARGHRIKTAINGHLCVDMEDSQGATRGIIALQLHSGGPMTIQFRNFALELNPSSNQLTSRVP